MQFPHLNNAQNFNMFSNFCLSLLFYGSLITYDNKFIQLLLQWVNSKIKAQPKNVVPNDASVRLYALAE